MNPLLQDAARIVLVGAGATALMDLWLALLRRLKVRSLDMALIGRWAGHLAQGRWSHEAIAKSAPVPHEAALGWWVHYGVGLVFAALLVALCGTTWLHQPALLPALVFGACTVAVPLFVMQPSMGAGIASSKTATPLANCLKSLATHTVFGVGLFVSALLIERTLP
ncbi:MAG TPA: DUF2938 domain-containing protein [Rhizobacter sp.]